MYLPVRSASQICYRLCLANTAACNMFGATEAGLLRKADLYEIDPDAFWPCCCSFTLIEENTETTSWFQQEQRIFSAGFVRIYTNIDQQRQISLQESDRHRFYRSISLQERSRLSVLQPLYDFTGQVIDFRIEFANYGDGIDDSHRDFEPYRSDIVGRLITEMQPAIRQTPLWEFYLYCLESTEPQRTELWYSNNNHSTALEVQGRRLDDGRLLISYSDVTEQHHLSQELESEKAWLATIFNNVPVGILILEAIRDENGQLADLRMIRRNEMGSKLSRIPQEIYERRPPLSELLKDEAPGLIPGLLEIVRTGIPVVNEVYREPLNKWLRGKAVKHGDGLMITLEDVTDAHQRTDQLQEQADLLAGVMEATPHAVMVYQAMRDEAGEVIDFKMLRCNKRAEELVYIPAETLLSGTMFSVDPQERSRLEKLKRVIAGKPETYEIHNAQYDQWRRITNTPFKDGFVTTMEDTTAQKQAAAKTEAQAKLFNAVLNHAPAATAVYKAMRDGSGEIIDFRPVLANKEALRIVGMSYEQFMAISLWDRMKGAGEASYLALKNVAETGRTLSFEHRSVFTNNWLSTTAARFDDGVIASSLDLTEHKHQHRIIEEQALLFDGVMRSLNNGLVIYRIILNEAGEFEDLEYVQVADSVLRDTGKTRGELIGHRLSKVFPGIEDTHYWEAYNRLIDTGEAQFFETHYNQHGLDNYLLNWLTPIGKDKMVSAYYIINDLKRTQKELEHTVRELRRSNEDLEQFASIASHDLQEPLRKVQSFGTMLEARFAETLGDEGKDLIRRMQNAAGRMRNLVTGLLSFSRLSGEEQGTLEPVDLHGLMQELSTDLQQGSEGPEPQILVDAQLPFVLGIESQLRHLFHNLLTNALKFRDPERQAEIRISSGSLKNEDIALLAPGIKVADYVRITVQDNGIGFEPEYAEKIFGLFERLHGMNAYQGTGIGLSIARRVAERHQGAIRAESEPGAGSTFIILLRRA
jgi:signal transduction histidine kinase